MVKELRIKNGIDIVGTIVASQSITAPSFISSTDSAYSVEPAGFSQIKNLYVTESNTTNGFIQLAEDSVFGADTNNTNTFLLSTSADSYVKTSFNVGIGKNNPTEKLDVNGNIKASAFIGSSLSSTGILALSSNNADYITLDGGFTNITKPVILTADNVGTTSEYTSLFVQTTQSLTASTSTAEVYGATITGFLATGAYSSTADYGVIGLNVYSQAYGNTGTSVANARGVRSLVTEQFNGTITNGIGYDSEFYGNFTNFYGFRQRPITWGTVTNAYGFYSEIPSSSTSYNFYAAGTAQNYFAGNVGIGTTAPTEKLEVSGNIKATSFVGNASTATKLATARSINGVSFDGSADITIPGSTALTAINDKTAGYTLVVADVGKLIQSTTTSAITITVPTNATAAIPIGSIIYLAQDNTGSVTVAAASGVTLKIPTGYQAVIAGRHSMVSLIKIATDTWRLVGDLLVA